MNNICSNGKITTELPPIHIQQPSMDSVLEMLNVINGILFVHIRYTHTHTCFVRPPNIVPNSRLNLLFHFTVPKKLPILKMKLKNDKKNPIHCWAIRHHHKRQPLKSIRCHRWQRQKTVAWTIWMKNYRNEFKRSKLLAAELDVLAVDCGGGRADKILAGAV